MQPVLDFTVPARFDGVTYEPALDRTRLTAQVKIVWALMLDRRWRSLHEIHQQCGAPEASISARLRDLRKTRFGGHMVNRRRRTIEAGTWEYQLVPNPACRVVE